MGRHRAGGDLLETMRDCLTAVRARADAAGVTVDLAVPLNPALFGSAVAPLDRLGRCLLRYAIGRASRGDRLLVRLDVSEGKTIALEIEDEGARSDHDSAMTWAGRPLDGMASARAIVDAAGGTLALSEQADGRLHLRATLPYRS